MYSGTGKSAVKLSSDKYTAADIEEIIYGGTLTSAELAEAKIKAFYEAGKAGSKYNNDLYEGMDIAYQVKVQEFQARKNSLFQILRAGRLLPEHILTVSETARVRHIREHTEAYHFMISLIQLT